MFSFQVKQWTGQDLQDEGHNIKVPRVFASILAVPLASISNSALRQWHIPKPWKSADICCFPKKNPITDYTKYILGTSLTPIA